MLDYTDLTMDGPSNMSYIMLKFPRSFLKAAFISLFWKL